MVLSAAGVALVLLEVEKSGAPSPCRVSFGQLPRMVPAVAPPVYKFFIVTVGVVNVDEIA